MWNSLRAFGILCFLFLNVSCGKEVLNGIGEASSSIQHLENCVVETDLQSPESLAWATRLSDSEKGMLGIWTLELTEPILFDFDLPHCVSLLPVPRNLFNEYREYSMKPVVKLPYEIGSEAFWYLDKSGALKLLWLDLSGYQVDLNQVNVNRWEGEFRGSYDFVPFGGSDEDFARPRVNKVVMTRK